MAPVAQAQVPGALVPGRQEERNLPTLPNRQTTPVLPQANIQTAPEHSEEITFTLSGVSLEGAETISPETLKAIWQDKLGKTISVATLYEFANAITQIYVDAGYALSFAFVPEQEIDGGRVTLRVIEGFVDEVVLAGTPVPQPDSWPDGESARAQAVRLAQKITLSKPLRTKDLERYLLLMNERPGISAQATFSASKTTPAASTLLLTVNYKPLDLSVSSDNRMSPSLGYWSMGASASLNGAFTGGDQLRVGWRCGIFCDAYNSTTIGWQTFVGDDGAQIGISAATSSETPGSGVLVPLGFNGNDKQVTLQASYPLARSRQSSLDIGGSFSVSNSETTIFSGTLTRDRVRTLDVYGSWSFADRTNAFNLLRLDLAQGLPIMGATENDDAQKSRIGGVSDFTTARLSVLRNQPLSVLSPAFQGYSLFLSGQAQSAITAPLLSVTQCFYGGSDVGRGYDSGAISGDSCVMGVAEVRRDFVVKNVFAQAYVFGDAGQVWRRGALPAGETARAGAQSYGLGVRLQTMQNMQADFQLAMPVREVFTSNGKNTPRAFISVSWQF